MSTINGVEYQELLSSASGGKHLRRRICLIAWDDLQEFVRGLYGYTQTANGTWERVAPTPYETGSDLYPKSHTLEGLACDGVDTRGNIHYRYAKLVVQFAPRDQEDEEDEPWVTIGLRSWTEWLPIPSWGLRWKSDSTALDQDQVGACPISMESLSLAKYHVADINHTTLAAYKDTLNNATFRGLPTGCWKFGGYSSQRTLDADGETITYTLTIELASRSIPWDYFWRPAYGWRQVEHTGGTALFTYKDFSVLGAEI